MMREAYLQAVAKIIVDIHSSKSTYYMQWLHAGMLKHSRCFKCSRYVEIWQNCAELWLTWYY